MATVTENDFIDDDFDFELELIEEKITLNPEDARMKKIITAKNYLAYFFSDKTMHCGGKIPKHFLFNERRVHTTVNIQLGPAVDKVYKALAKETDIIPNELSFEDILDEESDDDDNSGTVTDDMKKVIELLEVFQCARIPQQFMGGFLMIYLELCEGIKIEF